MHSNKSIRLTQFSIVLILSFLFIVSPATADIIVDNGDAQTSSTGTWLPSSGPSYFGTESLYARPEATYTWGIGSEPPGTYEVLLWWTTVSTRGASIAVEVDHIDGTSTNLIDQTIDGGQWNSIGTFNFDAAGSVTIIASNETLPGGQIVSTSADAVWFRRVSENEVIIDNGDPGTAFTGTWSVSSGSGFYGTESLFARPAATYSWLASSLVPGVYEVSMWWTSVDSRGTNIAVEVTDTSGTTTTNINQRADGGQWNNLGTFNFDGSGGDVTIIASSDIAPDGRIVSTSADAVRFVRLDVTTHTISATAGANGSISPSGDVTVNEGTDQTFTITPNTGYQVADVLVDGGSEGPITSYTFPNVTGDHTISATFQEVPPVPTYTLTATAGANGSISPSGDVTVNEGTDQTFTITPNTGYQVADVLVDGGSEGPITSYTFPNVTGDHTISATFQEVVVPTHTITATAGANGAISPSGDVTVNEGADQTFTITPNTGYQVADVLVDGGSEGPITSYTFPNVTGDHTISATFQEVVVPTHTITATAGANGAISPSGDVTVNEGADQTFTITPNTGYQVADVLVDGGSEGPITSYTFPNVTGDHTISATFQEVVVPTHTITATAGANGAISPSGDVTVNEGADQTFTITPNTGYQVADVLVDGGSIGAVGSHTFPNVTGDHTISASFEAATVTTEIIIDNGDAGTSSTGAWSPSGGPNSYGTTSIFARPSATYSWQFSGEPAGYFEVSMTWTVVDSRGTAIPVQITTGDGIVSTTIDQTTDGGQWNILGSYYFDGSGSVAITASSATLPDGRIVSTCADAVRFRSVTAPGPQPPSANFAADPSGGVMPLTVQFTDLSIGDIDSWLWDFGDGETSTSPDPSHTFTESGTYTVSLTVTNAYGSDTAMRSSYIQVAGADTENIYIALGWGADGSEWQYTEYDLADIGGVEIEPDVWRYINPDKGITYYIRPIDTVEAFEAALREEGSHVIYVGHSNYGWGLTFLRSFQQDSVRYFDDPLVSNVSTDMTDPSIPGLRYGQAYPNWNPELQNGESTIMPYDFGDPRGLPPYNYFATYTLPGDPTHYRIEKADGSYVERFPDSGFPAWYSPDGSPPDPVLNPEYFITNPGDDWERIELVGNWESASPGDWHTAVYYMGQNYLYHAPGSGSNSATFTLPVDNPGVYAVAATWYPDPANASNATYTIQHTDVGTGEYDTIVVDQRESVGFNILGAYYFDEGSYTVQLTDNADGNVVADVMVLLYLDDPQTITKSEFSADRNSGSGPLTVQFIDQSTIYINGNYEPGIEWQWDFGDGTTSQGQNPMHTYSAPGIYTVSLTVTDELGNTDTEVKESFIMVDSAAPLNAQFSAGNIMGTRGSASVNFLNQSTGDITSWLWDFGDGTTSTERNPTHTYNGAGTYTVTLTVSGPGGSDSETEVDFVYGTVGLVAVDNTFDVKPHYYRNYSGTLLGSTIMDASSVAFPYEELRYSRFFFNGCVSENYYLPKFTRGVVFYTLTNREALADPTDEYLINYLLGASDDEILQAINAVNFIHGYYDFTKPPPSMR